MAKSAKKTDKSSASTKKTPAKKVEGSKSNGVPISSKEILAKAEVIRNLINTGLI